MAEIVVSELATLDGVMEAPGGEPTHPHAAWVLDFTSDEQQRYKLRETREAERLLLGRVTDGGFAAAWSGRQGEFADKMNAMPEQVVSSTLRDPGWGTTTVLDGDVAAAVREVRKQVLCRHASTAFPSGVVVHQYRRPGA